jgi:hypothetical protein
LNGSKKTTLSLGTLKQLSSDSPTTKETPSREAPPPQCTYTPPSSPAETNKHPPKPDPKPLTFYFGIFVDIFLNYQSRLRLFSLGIFGCF